jgi:DNA-binding transcriptional regulator LsrR (DeoR family)
MQELRKTSDRAELLAEIAELYYIEGKDQSEIAKSIGVTRSMISRMLKEARASGIVEIRIHRNSRSDPGLEKRLIDTFHLKKAFVTQDLASKKDNLQKHLGKVGAQALKEFLEPDAVIGLAWGTAISATVDAFEAPHRIPARVVQLVGALGATYTEFDGHSLVTRFSQKLDGVAYYLNAPCYCQTRETAQALMETPALRDTVELGRQANIALLGIGSTEKEFSSFLRSGYIPKEEFDRLHKNGAVGNVAGIHFNTNGEIVCHDFSEHLVVISEKDLLKIPVRIGVAGGIGKVIAILGALRGGFVNVLVTDAATAAKVLELETKSREES